MILFIEYHKFNIDDRDNEINYCIEKNIQSKLFNKIVIFCDNEIFTSNEDLTNVDIVKIDNRYTYKDIISYCNNNYPNEICVLANTDIYFDDTLNKVKHTSLDKRFICITRWNVDNDGNSVLFDQNGTSYVTQDTWIFKTPFNLNGGDYYMGKPGCDNRIAYEAHLSKYMVCNPANDIKTYHLHNTNYRTYISNRDAVGSPYMGVYIASDINTNSARKIM